MPPRARYRAHHILAILVCVACVIASGEPHSHAAKENHLRKVGSATGHHPKYHPHHSHVTTGAQSEKGSGGLIDLAEISTMVVEGKTLGSEYIEPQASPVYGDIGAQDVGATAPMPRHRVKKRKLHAIPTNGMARGGKKSKGKKSKGGGSVEKKSTSSKRNTKGMDESDRDRSREIDDNDKMKRRTTGTDGKPVVIPDSTVMETPEHFRGRLLQRKIESVGFMLTLIDNALDKSAGSLDSMKESLARVESGVHSRVSMIKAKSALADAHAGSTPRVPEGHWDIKK